MRQLHVLSQFSRTNVNILLHLMERVLRKGDRGIDANLSTAIKDDMKQRESFKTEHGEYLPADIWPDLVQTEMQWRWVSVPEADHGDEQDVREDNKDGLGAQHEDEVPMLPNTSTKITPRRTTIVEERKNFD